MRRSAVGGGKRQDEKDGTREEDVSSAGWGGEGGGACSNLCLHCFPLSGVNIPTVAVQHAILKMEGIQTGDMKRCPGNGIEGAMVRTSLGSLLCPLFYFLDDVSYPQSVENSSALWISNWTI